MRERAAARARIGVARSEPTSMACAARRNVAVEGGRVTTYGPGGEARNSNRPLWSVTATIAVAPSADTTAPAIGDSAFVPHDALNGARRERRNPSDGLCRRALARCALEIAGKPRTIRPPTTADAINLDVIALLRQARTAERRGCSLYPADDGEVHVARQRLVRELVGDLDLEAIVAFRERRQRHGLAALELMAGGEIELRRQRLRVQALRVGLVEELLAACLLRDRSCIRR